MVDFNSLVVISPAELIQRGTYLHFNIFVVGCLPRISHDNLAVV